MEADNTHIYNAALRFPPPPKGFSELTNCAKIKTEPLPEFLRPKLRPAIEADSIKWFHNWLTINLYKTNYISFSILNKNQYFCIFKNGGLSEWLKEHAWKACVHASVPRVRIPDLPLLNSNVMMINYLSFYGLFCSSEYFNFNNCLSELWMSIA